MRETSKKEEGYTYRVGGGPWYSDPEAAQDFPDPHDLGHRSRSDKNKAHE
jgi:hypothetical protein